MVSGEVLELFFCCSVLGRFAWREPAEVHRRRAVVWPPCPQRDRWPRIVLARDVAHVLRVLAKSRFSPTFVPLLFGLDLRCACSPLCVGRPVLLKVPVNAQDLARTAPPSCGEVLCFAARNSCRGQAVRPARTCSAVLSLRDWTR